MLLANMVVALALHAANEPRFHLLESQLAVAPEPTASRSIKRCPSLFPKIVASEPETLSMALPGAVTKKSLADAFAQRTRVSSCVYGLQGVRRQDPRFGMRQLTLELPAPLAPRAPLHLMFRTVVGRFDGHVPEVYAGFSY